MNLSWLFRADATLISLLVAVTMFAAAALSAQLASQARSGDEKHGLAAIENGLLGLLGLLLAFTFSGAASRFEQRAALMVESANALRAAAMRTDLYPAAARESLRRDLRAYLDAQVDFYRAEHDDEALAAAVARSDAAQKRLWAQVSELARDSGNGVATAQMMATLDRLFALAGSRQVAARTHMPDAIVLLLFVMAVATAFTSGYGSGVVGRFSWGGYLGFALLTALVVYVTLDLDRPGRGIIRRDVQEAAIEGVRAWLGP